MGCLEKGNNVIIKEGCHIGENVVLGDDVYIDYNCIIRDNIIINQGTTIGANCILGEYQTDFYAERKNGVHPLKIGSHSRIRSGSIIYGDCELGDYFQTGHRVTIRESTKIGKHCSIGTMSDIQGRCELGDYVRCHSNVFICEKSIIKDYVWIFPHVVFTNDPAPPSNNLMGITVESFAVIAAGSILLPGIRIESDTLVAAGAVVTKDVKKYSVVGGNPAKVITSIDKIMNRKTGEPAYPWRYAFDKNMPWEGTGFDEWNTIPSIKISTIK